ncbi:MAG: amidohydrolase family protein, partial [Pseudomonadota bacterium]
ASAAPAAFLGLSHQRGAIARGLAADFCLLDDDLNVAKTWIDGKENHVRKEPLPV